MSLRDEGARLRDDGIERSDSAANPDWRTEFDRELVSLARSQRYLCASDVWARLNESTHEPRAAGARMRSAAAAGLIENTTYTRTCPRSSRHRAPETVWRSLIQRSDSDNAAAYGIPIGRGYCPRCGRGRE